MGQFFPHYHKIWQFWRDRSLRTKLIILLMGITAIPVATVTHSMIDLAEDRLISSLQSSLRKDSANFAQRLDQLKNNHLLQAIHLANTVKLSQIELGIPTDLNDEDSVQLDQLLTGALIETPYQPSFYIITDRNHRTIAQKNWLLSESSMASSLKLPSEHSVWQHVYDVQKIRPNVDLSDLPILRAAVRQGEGIASAELLSRDILMKMHLSKQASLPLRPQLLKNLTANQMPFPEEAFNIEQGEIGMVMMAVVPIVQENKIVGTAIVGTLLNRNYQLVDELKSSSTLSGATIFAQDLRISTNIPYHDGMTRAIATRGSRESMESLLIKSKPYEGSTVIVDERYQTVYQPIYDHRREFNSSVKPIGSYLVGVKEKTVDQTIQSLQIRGYWIGGSVIIVVGFLAIPLANMFARPLKKLSTLAENICQDVYDNERFESLSDRADEVGILARELNAMTDRLAHHLAIAQASEQQLLTQTQVLEATLKDLGNTQSQLVQSEKMSSLGQLVAGVAHEINNPVNFIYGNLKHTDLYIQDLLRLIEIYQTEYPQPNVTIDNILEEMDWEFVVQDLPEMMRSMKMGADRIKEIVLSLRIFSRMDEAEYKQADIEAGIDSTLTILNHRLKSSPKRPAIQVQRVFANLPKVECYAGQLNQVLMNIISNAIDAIEELTNAPNHQPEIKIETLFQNHHTIGIIISDNGPGIPEGIRSRLFDPFFTTKEVGKGTGMGLAISYQIIVDRHQGKLTCESTIGQGTRFIIEIPMVQINR